MLSIFLRHAVASLAAAFLLANSVEVLATPSFGSGDEWNAVPTFQSIGLYWAPPGGGDTVTAQVQFREAGAGAGYRQGLDLWYDNRNGEYRGSIVELEPNTAYDIILKLSTGYQLFISSCPSSNQCTRTWSETPMVPAGYTISVATGAMQLVIYSSNVSAPTSTLSSGVQYVQIPSSATDQTYTLITGTAPNNIIDQTNYSTDLPCIDIWYGVQYLIVRGLVLKNCKQAPIRLADNDTPAPTGHIIIEDNEMYGWGGGTSTDPYMTGAVHCAFYHTTDDANRASQIVIQRNKMHDPRYDSPLSGSGNGPVGVNFQQCGTNHVIRYNEIYSSTTHFSNGLYGEVAYSPASSGIAGAKGFPWADSDIYGNRISYVVRDNAINAFGANRNVRIWGNYMDQIAGGINNASTSVGPLYVWRNVTNQLAAMTAPSNPDTESRGPFVLGGIDSSSLNGGRAYYFHNTVLQPAPLSGFVYNSGAGYGIGTGPRSWILYNFVSLNNIWQIFRTDSTFYSISTPGLTTAQQQTISADYDLYNGALYPAGLGAANAETHGMPGQPTYSSTFTLPSAANGWTGDFSLSPKSFGYRAAVDIPNFNDKRPNVSFAADVGAQQSGTAPAEFGSTALLARLARTPSNGNAPLTVTFDPSGSRPAGSIASYSIDFGDGTPAGTGNAPQNHSYSANGTYTATLTVTSTDGRQATDSRLVAVGDGISHPANYELYVSVGPGLVADGSSGEAFNLTVQTADNRALSSVQFYVDNVLRSTASTAPFQWTWTTSANDAGNHVIRVQATDTASNVATESRNVTVLGASCAVYLGAASIEQGQPLSVQAVCSPYKTVTQVEFYVDGVLLGADTRAPYTWTVDTSTLASGSRSITARGKFSPSGQVDATQSVAVTASGVAINFNPGSVVRTGEVLTFGAQAADGRQLKQVDFYIDGNYRDGIISADTGGAFDLAWTPTNANIGLHTLLVQATDANNMVLTGSRQVFVTPNVCGLVVASNLYAAKSNDAVYLLPRRLPLGQRIPVQGICSASSTIAKVEFYRDGVLQATSTSAPYTWIFDTNGLTSGAQYTLTARAYIGGATYDDALTIEIVGP